MIYRDQLEAVYKLIEKPENWTQECYARTRHGAPIEEAYDQPLDFDGDGLSAEEIAKHPDAECWCLYGAAYKCGLTENDDFAFAKILGQEYTHHVTDFNDTHTHAEVLALLQSAIDRAPVRGES